MATIRSDARIHQTRVLDRRELAPGVIVLGLLAPDLVRATRAGQYVMAIPPRGEATAIALGIYEAEGERASLLFFLTGKRTRELGELRPGDALALAGPLGNGFDVSGNPSNAAIVAGGVGIASVLLAAQRLLETGARVELLYGARTSHMLVEAKRFADEGCELALATDDGSAGHHGFVTALLEHRDAMPDLILACGPSAMLRAVGRIARDRGVRAQLSLEETFACGVGGCWGCVVPLARTSAQAPPFPPAVDGSDAVYARICKEGPVFFSDELRW
jgi:dihydroorotate dehydrogenase electron transfer subunit